jgi:hypothetical protein
MRRSSLPLNKPMKRTLNSAVQSPAVPFGNDLFRLGDLGGAIQRRLSPIHWAAYVAPRSKQLPCDEHGTQAATFVCQPIVESVQDSQPRWFWWAEDPGISRPDAWCSTCEEKVQSTNGEWTDESETFASVKLLCGAWYYTARALNLGE